MEETPKVVQDNKRIAQFLGLENHTICSSTESYKSRYPAHDRWDLLMPAIEKIEDDLEYSVIINEHFCRIIISDEFTFEWEGAESKIKAAHQAVSEFIRWYEDYKRVSRIVVIGEKVLLDKRGLKIRQSLQDDGKTLKLFIEDRQ